jgi:hypothetical protein
VNRHSHCGSKGEPTRARSAFSLRAIVFGLLGAALIAGIANFSDSRVKPGALFVGSHLPVGASPR